MSFWKTDDTLYNQLMRVEKRVVEASRSRQQLLDEAVTELVRAPGKRIRPALVLLASRYGKEQSDSIIDVAAAMETLHIATLIHDDIVDETKIRKGNETTQSKYGKDIAVYAGDYLFTRCFQLLARAGSTDQMEKVAKAMTTICEGEVSQYGDRYDANSSVMNYLRKTRGKTATLFAISAGAGALHSKCDDGVTRLLVKYGLWFGMAFQIYDDLLDFKLESKDVGKPVGHDIMVGFYTLPVIYSLRGPNGRKLRKLLEIGTKEALLSAIDIVRGGDGLEQTERLFEKYTKKAGSCIDQLPDSESAATLYNLLESAFPKKGSPVEKFRIA